MVTLTDAASVRAWCALLPPRWPEPKNAGRDYVWLGQLDGLDLWWYVKEYHGRRLFGRDALGWRALDPQTRTVGGLRAKLLELVHDNV